jgi:cytochrome P450
VPSLGAGMDRWLPAQQSSGELRAYPALKRLTLDVATSTFMGVAPGAEAERVNRAFVDLVEASIAVVRLDLWPTSYHRGRRGRRLLEERFASLIGEKRRTALPDLFSRMCSAVSEEGERFSDREVIDHMTFVMMAAHDTSTSTLATAVWLLATHPEWQERLRHGSLGRPDHLDYDGLMDLEEIGWVAQEALRIHPPLPVFPRGVAKPVTVNGWDLEPGTLVCLSPILTHHDLSLWTEPTRFDPERFSPERQEHRSHKYAWAPFGGGVHQCLGQRFGTLEIRAALHLMLRRWRWSVRPGYRMPYQHVPIAKPMDDLPIRIERLSA